MDLVALSGIDISQSVMITGVSNTKADNEILDHLRTYGNLNRHFYVNDPTSTFFKNLISEFVDTTAFTSLEPLLPYTYCSKTVADRVFCITALACEYAATEDSSISPPNYLKELKHIADRSGHRFEDVLKTVMRQIGQHLHEAGADDDGKSEHEYDEEGGVNEENEVEEEEERALEQQKPFSPSARRVSTDQQGARPRKSQTGPAPRVSLTAHSLNPPEIQRVVVEHVVRNQDVSATTSLRLRAFSGRVPKPCSEADFESWRSQIDLLIADPSLSALYVTRRIIESLLSPAADLVKGLSSNTLPSVVLSVLDSAFGTVQDGEELYAQYLNILQNPGERPSAYLQRLQLTLSTVVKQGGLAAADMDKHLLKQFCRGCWDNTILTKLQLEQQKNNPPPFSDLLLWLRTEEDRQTAKESLMRKHIGLSKQKANIQSQSTCSCGHSTASEELKEMKKQLQTLQQQMSQLLSRKNSTESKFKPRQNNPSHSSPQANTKPKPWYCFNCGEDGHISSSCNNRANPSLVEQKKKQLRKKQQEWDAKTTSSLN
uniref:CCHC-type domain-containing protein n=1 Tax=Nothobranchius furzeri TaxID=105023 RepID=A0A8C6M378_NOTFU